MSKRDLLHTFKTGHSTSPLASYTEWPIADSPNPAFRQNSHLCVYVCGVCDHVGVFACACVLVCVSARERSRGTWGDARQRGPAAKRFSVAPPLAFALLQPAQKQGKRARCMCRRTSHDRCVLVWFTALSVFTCAGIVIVHARSQA
jgi:hypothetical protein